MRNIFRKSALDRLSSPEQLDKLITFTSPRSWLILATVGIVLCCAGIWSWYGTIPIKVDTKGILLSSGGVDVVYAKTSGQITDVPVSVGDNITAGDVIALIEGEDLVKQINKNDGLVGVLNALAAGSDWQNITVPPELLELQQLGLQIQTAQAGAEAVSANPQLAKDDYDRYVKLFEQGAVSREELDVKYSTYINAMADYSQQSLSVDQAVAKFNGAKQAKLSELLSSSEELKDTLESDYKIVAPIGGKITEVRASKGDIVTAGSPVTAISRIGSDVKELEGIIYVPVDEGKKLSVGMAVKIYPSTVEKEEYGYMKGTVSSVSEYPVSAQTAMALLGNEALVQELTSVGAPLEVHVDLTADAKTASGFKWSSRKGADLSIDNGTLCGASIVVDGKRPISMVIPLLKKKFLPFE